MPLDGGEERKGWVFEPFDDAVGGGGDDLQAAAETCGGLLVIRVNGDFTRAQGAAKLRGRVYFDGMARGVMVFEAAVLDLVFALNVGEELTQGAATVDVHELRAEADAQRGQAA